ncbi:hypothetical protein Q31a_19580 [Aureliella helgolandensis]|uniref:Uncharacterized protein n=1 Tax=Aureliella helgolandensis TaxID=2527968 RepID=A0A518G4Y3_9BACT|nr:hypothetical protein Q31a_19580 [Aureliella helgolandensis]
MLLCQIVAFLVVFSNIVELEQVLFSVEFHQLPAIVGDDGGGTHLMEESIHDHIFVSFGLWFTQQRRQIGNAVFAGW